MTCLVIAHDAGWVHNGLTLSNFIIEPETHRGVLIDFTNSVKIGSPAKSITKNKDDHPLEVMTKRPLVPATDLFMAQRVMRKLLGNTPITPRINALLNACALVNGRLNDARDVMRTFKDALLPIFGSPKFVEFKMP
jgi:serine/threonine protein kinase